MKLYDRFGAKGFHSSFATTFGIDFDTYENVCLKSVARCRVFQQLHSAGRPNAVLRARRRFHAAAICRTPLLRRGNECIIERGVSQQGLPAARTEIGRAAGWLREHDISRARRESRGRWNGRMQRGGLAASGASSPPHGPTSRRDWIKSDIHRATGRMDGSAHLMASTPNPRPALLIYATAAGAHSLRTDMMGGIGSQFMGLVDERPVKRLIVISPYWDDNLTALRNLIEELQPDETVLLSSRSAGSFRSKR